MVPEVVLGEGLVDPVVGGGGSVEGIVYLAGREESQEEREEKEEGSK